MSAVSAGFVPLISSLTFNGFVVDLKRVARWHAPRLQSLKLERVTLTVETAGFGAGAADAELDGARAAAAAASAALTVAAAARNTAQQNVRQMRLALGNMLWNEVMTAEQRAEFAAANAAVAAAGDAVRAAHAAKEAADSRVRELVAAVVARDLPAALPALTHVVFDCVEVKVHAQAAAEALRALGRRRARSAA